jgi:hypothetical protein
MSVQTLIGDFVQVGPDGRRAEGKIFLQKPGRIRFEYNPPSPIELVADGNSLVVRDRLLATQDLYPLSQTPLSCSPTASTCCARPMSPRSPPTTPSSACRSRKSIRSAAPTRCC